MTNFLQAVTLQFRKSAKHGQPFAPSDADKAIIAAMQEALVARQDNEAMLHRRIIALEEKLGVRQE